MLAMLLVTTINTVVMVVSAMAPPPPAHPPPLTTASPSTTKNPDNILVPTASTTNPTAPPASPSRATEITNVKTSVSPKMEEEEETAIITPAVVHEPSLPILTRLLDRLLLLSPKTWYGYYCNMCEQNRFQPLNTQILVQASKALFIPIVIATILHLLSSTLQNLLPMTFLSPWTIHFGSEIYPFVKKYLDNAYSTYRNRSRTLPQAKLVLQERLKQHRVCRFRRFDVYLPPPSNDDVSSTSATTSSSNDILQYPGILFLPGALVPISAYSEIASKLSDKGFIVVVVSMEPTRLAHVHLGADCQSIQRIMKHTQKYLLQTTTSTYCSSSTSSFFVPHSVSKFLRRIGIRSRQQQPLEDEVNTSSTRKPMMMISEWCLLGHSMGSFAAMRLYGELQRQQPQPVRKVVLWATMALVNIATDLSQYTTEHHADHDCHVLLVQGTHDMLVKMTKDTQTEFDKLLPPKTTTREVIVGGNHGGFASYESPLFVEDESLPRELQQDLACEVTSKFLLSTSTSKNYGIQ